MEHNFHYIVVFYKTVVFIRYLRDATQTFREFEYTAQTMSATNLLRSVPLAVSFNLQSAYWHLYKCTCFRVLAVFFTLFFWCVC